jgi:hypothetical protein
MHCFDDVRAILFIVNLAGFNQVLFEDSAKLGVPPSQFQSLPLLQQFRGMMERI